MMRIAGANADPGQERQKGHGGGGPKKWLRLGA
jgi:hypothetical protein